MLLHLEIYLILALSIITSLLHNVFKKVYNRCAPSHTQSLYAFNGILGLSCGIFVFILSIDPFAEEPFAAILDFSFTSAGLGILFGALVLLQMLTYMYALSLGPFSYTAVIVSLSTLIAALSGLFYGENIDAFQYVGMGIMVLCILLSRSKNSADTKKASVKWVVVSLISCVFNGGLGVMQKIHQSSPQIKDELPVFLLSCFAFTTVVSFAVYFVKRAKEKKLEGQARIDFVPSRKQVLAATLAGIALSVPHVANLYLAGQLPSAVFFPIINTGSLILTTIAARVIFKEKLSMTQWAGLILGIISGLFVSGTVSSWFA